MKYNINSNDPDITYASGKNEGKKVKRERYSNMIGYDFGGWIYDGAAYTETTRQYLFTNVDTGSVWVADYKEFREHIDKYDFPNRKLK